MAQSYSLAIYSFSIHRRLKKDETVVLSDFNHGTDFLDLIRDILRKWCYDLKNFRVQNDRDQERVFRIAKKTNGQDFLFSEGRFISGIIESGSYGTEEYIVNVDTGESDKVKLKNEALLRPFFFLFYIPKDSKIGFLILERISSLGIFSIMEKYLSSIIKLDEYIDMVFKLSPLTLKKLADSNIKKLDYEAKKIVIHQLQESNLKISRITDNTITDDEVNGHDVVYKAPVNKSLNIKNWLDKLRNKKKNGFYIVDNDIKFEGVDVEIKIGGKPRMLSIDDIQKSLGASMDITEHVKIDTSNGYPTFASLHHEAMNLVSYINSQYKLS